ncbi:MAPEG family protein [Roseiarcus sp.]|uniref:MAPEG family protein n=1 Tax=Roseiarcus sp. TaxID=1969460 RepID=UPI003F972335
MTIAIWCILIAAILPYVAFGFVKGLDPNQPRTHLGDLAGQSVRAYGAHLNGLETFPSFAAAVIVAHMISGPSRIADVLAVVYVLLRIGHMAAYIGGRQPLRSAAFGLAQLVAVAIFVSPVFR